MVWVTSGGRAVVDHGERNVRGIFLSVAITLSACAGANAADRPTAPPRPPAPDAPPPPKTAPDAGSAAHRTASPPPDPVGLPPIDAAPSALPAPPLPAAPTETAASAFNPDTCPQAVQGRARVERCRRLPELNAACRAGEATACGQVGDCHRERSPPALEMAIALYRHACERGDPNGCLQLGRMQAKGLGLPRDRPAAWRHLSRACQLDDAQGCAAAGLLRYLGAGVDRDEDEAATLLEKGCKGDSEMACLQLAILHARGAPKALIDQSDARALTLYRKACDLCSAKACYLAASRLQATPDAAREAARLRLKACALGHAPACAPGAVVQPAPAP